MRSQRLGDGAPPENAPAHAPAYPREARAARVGRGVATIVARESHLAFAGHGRDLMVRLGPGVDVAEFHEALLKIDVQGFELEVLRGAGDLLSAFEHVYVEASFEALYEGQALADEVIAHMLAAGFVEAGRHNVSFGPDGQPIQADFLFRRNA